MGLIRYLLLLALVSLAGWLLRRALAVIWRRLTQRDSSPVKDDVDKAGVSTVRCHQCGLFLPDHQAYKKGTHYYCPDHQNDSQS